MKFLKWIPHRCIFTPACCEPCCAGVVWEVCDGHCSISRQAPRALQPQRREGRNAGSFPKCPGSNSRRLTEKNKEPAEERRGSCDRPTLGTALQPLGALCCTTVELCSAMSTCVWWDSSSAFTFRSSVCVELFHPLGKKIIIIFTTIGVANASQVF